MIANFRQILFFADSLGQPSFPKQQYMQMMPQPLNLILGFAVSTRYMQIFICSSSDMKLLEFTMLFYFPL